MCLLVGSVRPEVNEVARGVHGPRCKAAPRDSQIGSEMDAAVGGAHGLRYNTTPEAV
jgi:hypothetical protein